MRIKLIGACIKHEKTDSAMKLFSDIISENPNVVINPILVLRLATHLITNSRTEDALVVLKQLKSSPEQNPDKNALVAVERKAAQLLDVAVDKKDADLAMQLFDLLKNSESFKITPNILLRVVKCHAVWLVPYHSFKLADKSLMIRIVMNKWTIVKCTSKLSNWLTEKRRCKHDYAIVRISQEFTLKMIIN